MAQINIKITQEQKEEIARVAKEKKISVTQLVIDSIQFYNDYIPEVENSSGIIDDDDSIENGGKKVENGKERIESDSIIPEIEIYKEMNSEGGKREKNKRHSISYRFHPIL